MRFHLSDVVSEGLDDAKRVGKQTSDAAEQLMDDTAERIRRHPAESIVMVFVAGFIMGGFVSWLVRQRN
jgi:hypothetical protein